MKKFEALIIGGSAGSLDVLLKVVPNLRADLSFPVVIVLHRKPGADQLLPDLLSAKTPLRVKELEEKELMIKGTIYIAPSDYHILIENDHTFSIDHSEKVNYSRPSIDVTFQSAADAFREHAVCILLSGTNADGVEGLKRVKRFGGKAIIQNPDTAIAPYMPEQARLHVSIDEILEPEDMAVFINQLSM